MSPTDRGLIARQVQREILVPQSDGTTYNIREFTIDKAYFSTSINTSGSASEPRIHLGDSIVSSMGPNPPRSHNARLSESSFETPRSNSTGDDTHYTEHPDHVSQELPKGYTIRTAEWFKPGRLFSIWDPHKPDRHLKEYVLLDTRNVDGTCLMVEGHEAGHSHDEPDGDFLREHVRVQNWTQGSRKNHDSMVQTIELSKFDKRKVDDDTWVHLERTYNIAFAGLICREHSILERNSLKALREYYIQYLAYTWDLESMLNFPDP